MAQQLRDIEADHPLIGTWVTTDEDSDAAFKFSLVDGEFRVSGFCQSDGEEFEITGVNWNGVALTFTATMPSTGFVTKDVFRIRSDGRLDLEFTTYEVWKKRSVKPGEIPRAWRVTPPPRGRTSSQLSLHWRDRLSCNLAIRMSVGIERLIKAENWVAARRAIRAKLRSSPKDHWLLTRLGLTYYEQKRYKQALRYHVRALAEMPNCPLVLWDYAGALEMLNRTDEALRVYRRLIRRGIPAIAHGDCGEGLAWARGLVADCHYRMAHCQESKRRSRSAINSLLHHIALRGPGCRSIYSLATIRKELRQLQDRVR